MLRQRRQLLKSVAWAAAAPLYAQGSARRKIAESDPGNMKLCHRVDAASVTDDDLSFFQQIGLEWLRMEFPLARGGFEVLQATRERLAKFKLRIYSAVHPAYRSLKVQLGQPGRDQDIETYCRFLRDLGKLQIPVASYDFHPANTYTTKMIQYRGYSTREFDADDFRARVEKQQFEREYSA